MVKPAGMPVSEWPLAQLRETVNMKTNETTVEEFMTTDLVTVQPDESVSQVAALMTWQSVRHVPVEDGEGIYVGLISSLDVIEQLSRYDLRDGDTVAPGEVAVEQIMDREAELHRERRAERARRFSRFVGSLTPEQCGRLSRHMHEGRGHRWHRIP